MATMRDVTVYASGHSWNHTTHTHKMCVLATSLLAFMQLALAATNCVCLYSSWNIASAEDNCTTTNLCRNAIATKRKGSFGRGDRIVLLLLLLWCAKTKCMIVSRAHIPTPIRWCNSRHSVANSNLFHNTTSVNDSNTKQTWCAIW